MTIARQRVIVVGAGAAGMSAAIAAADAGAEVTLLNAHPRIGLKILMSGGTRCNVTHRAVDARDFRGGSQKVVARILRAFTPAQTLAWFGAMGVELKLEDTGKYFPVTDTAETVIEALLADARRAGVTIRAGTHVIRVHAPVARADSAAGGAANSATPWRIGTVAASGSLAFPGTAGAYGRTEWPLVDAEPDTWHEADAVILATGGLSFPRTGSDGTGYSLVQALGHTLIAPIPALTPLTAPDPLCARAPGLTVPAALTLWVDGKRDVTCTGSLLFTHIGYSGPAALDLSRHWLRAAAATSRRVTLSVLPGTSLEVLTEAWLQAQREEPKKTARRFFAARMPERLAEALCAESGIAAATPLGQVDKARRTAVLACALERELPVTGTLGFEKAEVTAGGVPLGEVDASTLESRRVPGLFLCGEILDVDGRLGGFNFQWAWSSGHVAGAAAARGR